MIVKIYAKDIFEKNKKASADDGEEEKYYVARMSADGTMTILNAKKDGDYLVFETESLESFAILTSTEQKGSASGYDWLLYVGIGIGVLLIGIALLIVKLRA